VCSGKTLWKLEENGQLNPVGPFDDEPGEPIPFDVIEDRQGAVWMATARGLFHHDRNGFDPIPVAHRAVLSLLEDREGNIWAGTQGGGLTRIRPRALELEDTAANLPHGVVQSVCEQTNGIVWAVTEGGTIGRRDADGWHEVSAIGLGRKDTAACVASDPDGSVWIGTRSNLVHVQDGQFTIIGPAQGLRCQNVRSLLVSHAGALCVAGADPEVQWLKDGTFHTFEIPAGLGSVRTMSEDVAGNIWMATVKGGFFSAGPAGITNEAAWLPKMPPGSLSIRSLLATPDGGLWIGFAHWGLGRLKDGHFDHIGTEQGLYDDFISQVLADDNGWLWCGSDHGIFKIRRSEFEAVVAHHAEQVRSVVYGREEGISQTPAIFDHHPSAMRGRDGRLWMPTRLDLAVIDPEKVLEHQAPPPALLEQVSVDGRVLQNYRHALAALGDARTNAAASSADGVVELPRGHQRMEFKYTALSFSALENVDFRYRLEGLDDHWIDAGPVRQASYSRLPAGRYRFAVKACSSDGVWGPETASFAFVVLPYVWETWWFRVLATVAFMAVIGLAVRYVSFRRLRSRLQQMEQEAALGKERARIARDIHDDVGGSLTEIGMLIELALAHRGNGQNGDEAARLVARTRHATESLDAIVWAINPNNDSVPNLADYLSEFAVDFLGAASVRCRLDLPKALPELPLSPEARHNVFLVVKEALNNVVRHAKAEEVQLRIACDDGGLRIEIADNGRGFDGRSSGPGGNGLRNMHQRLASVGGKLTVDSRPGAGTRVRLELPMILKPC